MLPSYSSPLVLRALRLPVCRVLPAARFSASALHAEGEIQEASPVSQTSPESEETRLPSRGQLPYFVHRTNTNNLPVYAEAKRGGSLRQTRIRKIEGNVNALRDDLIKTLNLEPEWVTINGVTNHILIKGWKKDNVEKVLKELNF